MQPTSRYSPRKIPLGSATWGESYFNRFLNAAPARRPEPRRRRVAGSGTTETALPVVLALMALPSSSIRIMEAKSTGEVPTDKPEKVRVKSVNVSGWLAFKVAPGKSENSTKLFGPDKCRPGHYLVVLLTAHQ